MSWNDAPDYTPQIKWWHGLIAVVVFAAFVWWRAPAELAQTMLATLDV